MSSSSNLDTACELVERLAGEPISLTGQPDHFRSLQKRHERAIPRERTLFVVGDADFGNCRRGYRASKHRIFISRLKERLKKRHISSVILAIDEYMTSQRCPRCLEKLTYLRRKAGPRERKKKDDDGCVNDFRVQFCEK
jgi:hypothetical protein